MLDQQGLALGATIVKQRVEEVITDDNTLEEKAVKVFKASLDESNVWFVDNDHDKFLIGITALTVLVDEETKWRIKKEVKFLQGLNAATSGLPVDLGQLMEGMELIGLQKLFEQAKGAPVAR